MTVSDENAVAYICIAAIMITFIVCVTVLGIKGKLVEVINALRMRDGSEKSLDKPADRGYTE